VCLVCFISFSLGPRTVSLSIAYYAVAVAV